MPRSALTRRTFARRSMDSRQFHIFSNMLVDMNLTRSCGTCEWLLFAVGTPITIKDIPAFWFLITNIMMRTMGYRGDGYNSDEDLMVHKSAIVKSRFIEFQRMSGTESNIRREMKLFCESVPGVPEFDDVRRQLKAVAEILDARRLTRNQLDMLKRMIDDDEAASSIVGTLSMFPVGRRSISELKQQLATETEKAASINNACMAADGALQKLDGLTQLTEETAIQLFPELDNVAKSYSALPKGNTDYKQGAAGDDTAFGSLNKVRAAH